MKQRSFDEIVKQKADNYEAPVPADAWENIVRKKKRKKRIIFFWWIPVGLLLVSGSLFYISNKKASTPLMNETVAQSTHEQLIANKTESQSQDNTATVQPGSMQSSENDTESKTSNVKDDQETRIDLSGAGQNDKAERKTNTAESINKTRDVNARADHQPHINANRNINDKERGIKSAVRQPSLRTTRKKSVAEKETLGYTVTRSNASDDRKSRETTGNKAGNITNPAIDGNLQRKDRSYEPGLSAPKTEVDINRQPLGFAALPFIRRHAIDAATPDGSLVENRGPIEEPVSKETIKLTAIKTKWRGYFEIMPLLPFQKSIANGPMKRIETGETYRWEYTADNVKTRLERSVAFGFGVSRQLNSSWTINGGLQYVEVKEKVSMSGVEARTDYTIVQRLATGSGGPILEPDTVSTISTGRRTINALNSYKTFTIPVILQYRLSRWRKFDLDVTGGLAFNISRKYSNSIRGTFTHPAPGKSGTEDGSGMGIDLHTGIRLTTPFRRKFNVYLEPALRTSIINSSIKTTINTNKIHQLGLRAGVGWYIR